jgi:hypothetical protein
MVVQGQKYAKLTLDLFPAKRVFRPDAKAVVKGAWHTARQGCRGGSLMMGGDRLDVYRLPMAGVGPFLEVLQQIIKAHTDMEPFRKEHVRRIVERYREAGYPLDLIRDTRGGGAILITAALPPELIGEVKRYRHDITAFPLEQPAQQEA